MNRADSMQFTFFGSFGAATFMQTLFRNETLCGAGAGAAAAETGYSIDRHRLGMMRGQKKNRTRVRLFLCLAVACLPVCAFADQFFDWSTSLFLAIHGIIARSFAPTCSI